MERKMEVQRQLGLLIQGQLLPFPVCVSAYQASCTTGGKGITGSYSTILASGIRNLTWNITFLSVNLKFTNVMCNMRCSWMSATTK